MIMPIQRSRDALFSGCNPLSHLPRVNVSRLDQALICGDPYHLDHQLPAHRPACILACEISQ